jgi:hypothetical protein
MAFREDKTLGNCHHRLTAQVKTKRTIAWPVVEDVTDKELLAIDRGTPRQAHVNAGMLRPEINAKVQALINAIVQFGSSQTSTSTVGDHLLLKIFDQFRENIESYLLISPRTPHGDAVFGAVIIRALYHGEDYALLSQIVMSLRTNVPVSNSQLLNISVNRLRSWLQDPRNKRKSGGGGAPRTYGLEYALSRILQGKQVKRILSRKDLRSWTTKL